MQILGLLGMYFDAVVVFVTSQTLLFRLALAILWQGTFQFLSWNEILELKEKGHEPIQADIPSARATAQDSSTRTHLSFLPTQNLVGSVTYYYVIS